ncbi:MAG: helix-turn-helix domain-containing protein [Methylophilus sp.]
MARKAKSKAEEEVIETSAVDTPEIQPTESMSDPLPDTVVQGISNCGGELKLAREKLNLSIQDISNQLRLSPKQVEAIETDEFEKLPEPTIVRGFIRNYAKLLKIDAQPILVAYSELAPNAEPPAFTVKSNSYAPVIGESKISFSPVIFISLLLIFTIIGGLFYYYTQNAQVKIPKEITQLNAQADTNNSSESKAPVEFALPPAERQATASDTATESVMPALPNDGTVTPIELPPTTATTNSEPVLPIEQTVPSTTKPVDTPLPTASTPTSPTTEIKTGLAKLNITSAEESWINVIDASGKEVFSQILPAGSSQNIQAKQPLNITIGNASATTLTMNGKTIDLAPFTRDKVAHIKLD